MNGTRGFGIELPWQSPKAGPDLNCCSVNANRALGMIALWALMQDDEGLVLNFYGPGTYAAALPSGNRVVLRQVTEYPRDGNVRIEVLTTETRPFAIKLRIPQWSRRSTVAVNGEALPRKATSASRVSSSYRCGRFGTPPRTMPSRTSSAFRTPGSAPSARVTATSRATEKSA